MTNGRLTDRLQATSTEIVTNSPLFRGRSWHPTLIERINHWLKAKGITLLKGDGFDHYRVVRAVLPALSGAALKPAELARVCQGWGSAVTAFFTRPNYSMQRAALRAAFDAERWADRLKFATGRPH